MLEYLYMTIVVANWKMNPATWREALRLFVATKKAAISEKTVDLIIAPPFLYLRELGSKSRGVALAAQDANASETGPHTGEISMMQVKDAKTTHVIIGHAERRAAGETDEQVRAKVASALRAGLVPIVCIGETTRNDHGAQFDTVRVQIRAAFADVPAAKVNAVIVAYEPVWAIGAPAPMNPRDMHEMSIFIRKTLTELYAGGQKPVKVAPTILYGGAVDASNAIAMMDEGGVSGFLVGRVSIDITKFRALLKTVARR